jgi:diguanylate cyclase (GGDEF)-like protein
MTRALPWHLNGATTYHNNTDCSVGTTGDALRYALSGTGDKHLCAECQHLNEFDAPRVRLAARDGVVADSEPIPSRATIVRTPPRNFDGLLRANLVTMLAYAVITMAMEGYFRVEEVTPPFVGGPAMALLALLIGGIRVWPGVLLGAVIVNVALFTFPVPVAVLHADVTVLAAGGAAALMRFRSRARRPALTLEEVLRFLAFGLLLHAAAAAVGHYAVDLAMGRATGTATFVLTHGFVTGLAKIMLSVPAVMLLWIDRRPFSRDRWAEMAAIAAAVILLSAARLWTPLDLHLHPSMPFVALFVCTWLAMRFTQREGFVLFSLAMMVAAIGTGIDTSTPSGSANALILGITIAACMTNVLLVSAIADERRVSMMLAGAHALTGVASRISFFDRARQEAEAAKERSQPLTVAVFDLDLPPGGTLEETHDRAAAMGRNMAAVIVPQLRRRDVLAHLGHEEFMLLLPRTGLREAQSVCEYLRRAVAEAGPNAQGPSPSVSFGITAYDTANDSIESSLRRAKQALRLAKEIGGNRVAAA